MSWLQDAPAAPPEHSPSPGTVAELCFVPESPGGPLTSVMSPGLSRSRGAGGLPCTAAVTAEGARDCQLVIELRADADQRVRCRPRAELEHHR
jgi:hypothetical protein